MQVLPLLMMAAMVLGGCKLHRENTTQDKFGRAISKIPKGLVGEIDVAIKKFFKDGNSDDIGALLRKGGKAGDEAIAAFRRVFTSKEAAVGTKLRDLQQAAEMLRNKYPSGISASGGKIDFNVLLAPYTDDVSNALDEMLEVAQKYYRILPAMADDQATMKKLYAGINSDDWLEVKLYEVYDLKRSSEFADKVRRIKELSLEGYGTVMAKSYNLPIEDHALADFWMGLGKTKASSKEQVAKFFNEMMVTNQRWGDSFWRKYTEKNVANIEDTIYNKIPKSKSTAEIHYYLDTISHEIQALRKNAVRRNTATRVVFSEENLKTVQKNNQNYLLEISRTGRELDPAAPNARVFGIWGNDVYDKVIAWEKKTGKELSSGFEDGIDVRDTLYNLQDYCKGISC